MQKELLSPVERLEDKTGDSDIMITRCLLYMFFTSVISKTSQFINLIQRFMSFIIQKCSFAFNFRVNLIRQTANFGFFTWIYFRR